MKSRRTGTFAITALAAVTVSLVVFWRPASVEAVYPIERLRVWFVRHVGTRVAGAFDGAAAAAENVRLRREVDALRLVDGDVVRIEAENARLRQTLGYAARLPGSWLAAVVLARGGGAAGDDVSLRIGRGSLDGVTAGAVVAVGAGLVGRIGTVTPHTATVVPLTDVAVKVACEAVGPDGVCLRGILCGGDADALAMRHLSDAGEVPLRSRVRTSGLGGVFPSGLEIGSVRAVRTDAAGHRSELVVESAVDFESLQDVFVRIGK